MDRLDKYVARRHEIANRYDELLAGLPLRSQRVWIILPCIYTLSG